MNKKMLFGGVVLFLIGVVVFNNPPLTCPGLGCPADTWFLPVMWGGIVIAAIGIVLFAFGLLARKNVIVKLGVSIVLIGLFFAAFYNGYLIFWQIRVASHIGLDTTNSITYIPPYIGPGSDAEVAAQAVAAPDIKDTEYVIEGQLVKLVNGEAQSEAAPGSSSKVTTKYFGNELKTDLNNDGREDVVFLLTQNRGGSGTFYYVVAALNTAKGYVGSNGHLLGDRIAPQTIEMSSNPKLKNVLVVNYADREAGQPMTTQPSVGKTAYLTLDTTSMLWGVVIPDAADESH